MIQIHIGESGVKSHKIQFFLSTVRIIYTAWRKCVKRLFGIPQRTHGALLSHICNDYPVSVQLHCRFSNFIKSCTESENEVIRIACRTGLCNPISYIASSNSYLNTKYGLTIYSKNKKTQIQQTFLRNVNNSDERIGAQIKDMFDLFHNCRDHDILEIIEELCCN